MRQQLKRLENCAQRDDSLLTMKSQLIAIVAAVLVVGCGEAVKDVSIHDAAYFGNIEVVKRHLAAGVDVNLKAPTGLTSLHSAAFGDEKEVAELLITKGADVNAKYIKGETPLDWAIKYNNPEIADLLRKHGGKTRKELKAEGK